jgi:hypothetical protein
MFRERGGAVKGRDTTVGILGFRAVCASKNPLTTPGILP